MKLSKKEARIRRATKFRAKHSERDVERLCVFKSSQHIYAQIISGCGTKTLASASSVSSKLTNGSNIDAASQVGDLIAKAAKKVKFLKSLLIVLVLNTMDVLKHLLRLLEKVD
jgi:large subunit ribosomal protein L18